MGLFRPVHPPSPAQEGIFHFQASGQAITTASLTVTRQLIVHICSVGEGQWKPKCNALYGKDLPAIEVLCHTGESDRITEKEDPPPNMCP